MSTSSDQHRKDLAQCLIDLSQRAGELKEFNVQCILLVVAASIADDSDYHLSLVCQDYAKLRILLINEMLKKEKESPKGDSDDEL